MYLCPFCLPIRESNSSSHLICQYHAKDLSLKSEGHSVVFTTLSIHLPLGGHLYNLHLLAIVDNAVLNIIYMFIYIFNNLLFSYFGALHFEQC